MWLTNSSIGRKLIMSITGACLVLFVTFHVLMNSVAIIWPAAYNSICAFLGANWYALVATAGLGFLFVVHIIYAVILTLQNRNARGADRYAVTSVPKQVEWSSQNMLVLGIVVVAFLVVHFIQFWYKMQFQEIIGTHYTVDGAEVPAAAGTLFIQLAFQDWWTPVVYIIGFAALWLHMNHGFWSMFQSAGWNGSIWLPRLKKIACAWTSIVIGLFVIQAIVFTWRASENYYIDNEELKQQYIEMWQERAGEVKTQTEMMELQEAFVKFLEKFNKEAYDQMQAQQQMYQQYQDDTAAESVETVEPENN